MPVALYTGIRMNRVRLALSFVLIGLGSAAMASPDGEFAALLEEHWEWLLAEQPTFASSLGDKRYNDRWPDQSVAAIEQRRNQTREFLRRVYAIDRSSLSDADQLNHELFRRYLQEQVDAFSSPRSKTTMTGSRASPMSTSSSSRSLRWPSVAVKRA